MGISRDGSFNSGGKQAPRCLQHSRLRLDPIAADCRAGKPGKVRSYRISIFSLGFSLPQIFQNGKLRKTRSINLPAVLGGHLLTFIMSLCLMCRNICRARENRLLSNRWWAGVSFPEAQASSLAVRSSSSSSTVPWTTVSIGQLIRVSRLLNIVGPLIHRFVQIRRHVIARGVGQVPAHEKQNLLEL